MTDIVKRLRERMLHCPIGSANALLLGEAYTEIERLEHMKANLHSHIKRLEDENAKLKRAMQSIPQNSTPAQSDGSTGSRSDHAPDAPDS